MNASTKSASRGILASLIAVTACGVTGAASAAPPASLANTTWTMQVNRDIEQLTITSQSGPGAPGAAICRIINGTFGAASIRGFYCPDSGHTVFVHRNAGNANTVRVFTGNVSDDEAGQTLYMGGTMAVLDAAFGDYREYNFAATN